MAESAIHEDNRVSELALSIAWHAGLSREVTTCDGDELAVIFPGHWTHGHGPDFRDAMLETQSGRLIIGSVELHHRASDWSRHGHHTDPAYNDVVLHIVTTLDEPQTRRLDGALVPVAVLRVPDAQLHAVQQRNPDIWSQFGGDICAPRMAAEHPDRIRAILWNLGDLRFDQRVLRYESELSQAPPAEVLVPALFEAFGYSRNRDQMRLLAERIDWATLTPRFHQRHQEQRIALCLAVMLGVGGWLPVSPAHASLAGLSPDELIEIERLWASDGTAWHHARLAPTIWDTARVRPANHPVARIATLAALLGSHGHHLAPVLFDAIREGTAIDEYLRRLCERPGTPPLGADRAIAITASVVVPFAVAWARTAGDDALEDAAMQAWSTIPAGTATQPARRARHQIAGDARLAHLKERGNQGLLYLDRHFCGPRRCYECPIARAVVAEQLSSGGSET